MKKLIFLFSFIMLASAGAWAQTALTPEPDVEYTYSVAISGESVTGTPYDGATGTYTYWITQQQGALLVDANKIDGSTTNFFTVSSATPYDGASKTWSGANQIKITWSAQAVADGNPFYLMVKYDDGNGCTNIKGWEITPSNYMKATLAAFDGTSTYDDNYAVCAGEIASASFSGGVFTYDYGVTKLYYRIEITSGIDPTKTGWVFNMTAPSVGTATATAKYATAFGDLATSTNTFTLGSDVSIAAGTGGVIFVEIDLAHPNMEMTTEQSVSTTLTVTDAATNAATIYKSDGTTTDNAEIQIIKARPTMTINP